MPVIYALIGAGLFVHDAYLSLARNRSADWNLSAIWSRSERTVTATVAVVAESCPATKAYYGEQGLAELLADPTIQAVLIALPAQVQLDVVKKALAAGKHVLEEKPIGPTLPDALELLAWYHLHHPQLVWGIAENYRFEGVFLRAREVVKDLGDVFKVDLVADMPMTPGNKYFSSAWRRDGTSFPGGFIADGAVHYIAALRMIAHAAGLGEAVQAAGTVLHVNPLLPPPDTLVGYLRFSSGKLSSLSVSYGAAQMRFSLSVVGTKGSLECQRGGWGIGRGEYYLCYKRPQDPEPIKENHKFIGVERELDSFFATVQGKVSGSVDEEVAERISADEGARDLAIVDAMLRSSAAGGQVVQVTQVPAAPL